MPVPIHDILTGTSSYLMHDMLFHACHSVLHVAACHEASAQMTAQDEPVVYADDLCLF